MRRATWSRKLEERRAVLSAVNTDKRYDIRLDDAGEKPTREAALFEKVSDGEDKRRMWAGTTITLAQEPVRLEGNVATIPVYPINYTEWIACDNPEYAKAFRDAGLPLPYAGIGISVLMETTDELFILTRRGIETPVYPGRLYSPGGGPKPGETSTEAMLQEILEETGLKPEEHFDPLGLTMLALVSDSRYAGSDHSRPEVVAYMPLSTTFAQTESIQYERAKAKGQEADVWAVEAFSSFPPTFGYRLALHGSEMCPPTEAGLAHIALFKHLQNDGKEAMENVDRMMKRLRSYERHAFIPPLKQLASH